MVFLGAGDVGETGSKGNAPRHVRGEGVAVVSLHLFMCLTYSNKRAALLIRLYVLEVIITILFLIAIDFLNR